jgi:hypothetical protein
MGMNTVNMRFKMIANHDSSAFDRSRRVRPIVSEEVIIAKEEISFVRYFSFCNACNRYIMVKTIVLPGFSFGRFIETSNIMCGNVKMKIM